MPVSTHPASERAYLAVKSAILSGEVTPGALLSEVDYAGRLSLSRTPVHEAFLRLESEDLLTLIPRRGAVVVPVPPAEAVDILEVRVALETAAARRLVTGGGDLTELLDRLEAEARRQAAAGRRRDVEAFARSDAEFHRAIVTASGNALADRFYGQLTERQQRMTIGAIAPRPARMAVLVSEHRALARLLGERKTERFGSTLVRHLEATHDLLLGR